MSSYAAGAHPAKPYRGMAMEGGVARWYARITKGNRDASEMAALLAPMVPAGGDFLEVAPGPGYHTIDLARRCDCGAQGLDISETFVDIASANSRAAGVDVTWTVGNASAMPYADEMFDLVVCQAAFKNFTQPVEALSEMRRVLKPGGTALVYDLRRDATRGQIEEEVRSMGLGPWDGFLTRLTFRRVLLKNAYTSAEMRAMAREAGFTKCDVDTTPIGMRVWMRD